MTPTLITTLAASILSILFEYVPGLSTWYTKQPDTAQRLIMLGLLVVVVGGAFGLSCAHWVNTWPCTQTGVKDAVYALLIAVGVNQGTFQLLPKGKS